MRKKSSGPQITLPKDALSRINLGQSFAEYDTKILLKPGVFVVTPAVKVAIDPSFSKCFFVGRRGTGKTAITYYIEQKKPRNTLRVLPQIFSSLNNLIDTEKFRNPKYRLLKSLVSCFKRALVDEVLVALNQNKLLLFKDYTALLNRERKFIENCDFDVRLTG